MSTCRLLNCFGHVIYTLQTSTYQILQNLVSLWLAVMTKQFQFDRSAWTIICRVRISVGILMEYLCFLSLFCFSAGHGTVMLFSMRLKNWSEPGLGLPKVFPLHKRENFSYLTLMRQLTSKVIISQVHGMFCSKEILHTTTHIMELNTGCNSVLNFMTCEDGL